MDQKAKSKQPSIRQLQYFVNIAMSSNFRKAAQKLNISQPTLTSQIATLEGALGVKLFERSRAGTLLSPAGRELLPLVRQLLEQFQQVMDQVDSSHKELSGTFKIGVSPTIGPYLFSKVLIELHKRYPRLKLHVREGVPQELEQGLDNLFSLCCRCIQARIGLGRFLLNRYLLYFPRITRSQTKKY